MRFLLAPLAGHDLNRSRLLGQFVAIQPGPEALAVEPDSKLFIGNIFGGRMAVDLASPRPEFVAWRRNPSCELQQRTGQLESGAVVVRWFDPGVVPGLLQTRDYARAVLGICVGDPGDVRAALEQRLARQRRWRVSEVRTHFVLGEQALYTIVGKADTTRTQLEMLLRPLPPNSTLGILPRNTQFHIASTNFVIFDHDQAVVETVTGSLRVTDPADIGDYLAVFDILTECAVQGADAHALIGHAITTHE
ncbi:hypothetical protein J2W56_006627 [Nocardia kruczakiae]|uniref:DUF5753 domain-containing protein n=1 Tax=Nocardia kruczakiae TaxID=261477 RepID=A0ABU1XQQ9_9NOCA|nr:DUF5753 domain-containing protein [Nocardia kruczakiae]MDR7172861.1 hypothetical protein [Nocardia kruczakiae]